MPHCIEVSQKRQLYRDTHNENNLHTFIYEALSLKTLQSHFRIQTDNRHFTESVTRAVETLHLASRLVRSYWKKKLQIHIPKTRDDKDMA